MVSFEARRWETSGDIYANLAPRISCYVESAKLLLDAAGIGSGMVVADVGCGSSGIVVNDVLRRQPDVSKVYAVDLSKGMLDALSRRVDQSRVSLVHGAAEDIDKLILEKVDRIVSNSALWLFSLDACLPAMRKTLSSTGTLTFNIADWDLDIGEVDHPRYDAIDQALLRAGHPPKKHRGSSQKHSVADLERLLNKGGFGVAEMHHAQVSMTASDWKLFYEIPAIAQRSLPDLELKTAMALLSGAMDELRLVSDLPAMRWLTIVCLPAR